MSATLKVACVALLLLSVVAILAAIAALEYEFSVAYVATPPWVIVGGEAYVHCSGFQDVGCNCYVISDEAPNDLYLMATWFADSADSGSIIVSQDGRLVVGESDFADYSFNALKAEPDGIPSHLLYSRAFDLETKEYVTPKNGVSSKDEAAQQARHEGIAKMLEAHGGVGSSFPMSMRSFEMRRMGYWEWRRWRKMINAAYDRRLN